MTDSTDNAEQVNYASYLYPTYDDEEFNIKIYKKKEFNDLKVSDSNDSAEITEEEFINRSNKACSNTYSFRLKNYQRFVRNYLSFQTPYNSLLLYHGLGTGKTCSAILIAEEMREYIKMLGLPTEMSIYVVSNDNVKLNFMKQLFDINEIELTQNNKMIMNTCIGDKIIKEFFEHIKKPNYVNKERFNEMKEQLGVYVKKYIIPSYNFITYGQIPSSNYSSLSNKLFIIDEIHNIKEQSNSTTTLNRGVMYTIEVKDESSDKGEDSKVLKRRGYLIKKTTEKSNANKSLTFAYTTGNDKLQDEPIRDDIKVEIGETLEENRGIVVNKVSGKIFYLKNYRVVTLSEKNVIIPKTSHQYDRLTDLIKKVDNLKLLFLSATPMFDKKDEIKNILNLLRSNDNRHLISSETNLMEENIAELARGYVSFVPGDNPYTFPFRLYPNQFNKPSSSLEIMKDGNKYLDLFMDRMDKYQYQIVQNIYSKDKSRKTVKGNEERDISKEAGDAVVQSASVKNSVALGDYGILQSASVITYPIGNGNSGITNNADVKDYVGKEGLLKVVELQNIRNPLKTYKMREGYDNFFGMKSMEKHACKIYNILQPIIDGKIKDGIIMVYGHFLEGTLIPFALALEYAGYVRYDGKDQPLLVDHYNTNNIKGKYALFTGDDKYTAPGNKKETIDKINSVENIEGQLVKFILISSSAAEGIDFKNIRQVHILTPWHNISKTEQIIGRAVRNCSHKKLDFEERNVEIYMHCAYYDNGGEYPYSPDFNLYQAAFKKASEIGKISRKLKESSIDCLINQDYNNVRYSDLSVVQKPLSMAMDRTIRVEVKNLPYSMNCDYQECPESISSNCKLPRYYNETDIKKITVDETTFNETFMFMNNDEIIKNIQDLFHYRTYYNREDILREIGSFYDYSHQQVSSALSEMVNNKYSNLLYNRTSEEQGYLVNIGEYYMFQPSPLTYKKIGSYERQSKIPSSNISVATSVISNKEEEINQIINSFSADTISKVLELSNNDDINQGNLSRLYDKTTDLVRKHKIDFLKECLCLTKKLEYLKEKIEKRNRSIHDTLAAEESLISSAKSMSSVSSGGGKGGKKKGKAKKEVKEKEEKLLSYSDYVVRKIINMEDEDDNKVKRMKETIIQNYMDKLSYTSQSNLIRYWFKYCDQTTEENCNVIKESVKDDASLVTEYIKRNEYTYGKKKNKKCIFLLDNEDNDTNTKVKEWEFDKDRRTYDMLDKTGKNDSQIESDEIQENNSYCFYGVTSGQATKSYDKTFKLITSFVEDGSITGRNCITLGNEDILTPMVHSSADNIKEEGGNQRNRDACFEIEFLARMKKLVSTQDTQRDKLPEILYFSQYALAFMQKSTKPKKVSK